MPSEVASHAVFSLPPTTVVGTLKVEGRTGRMLLRSGLARANCMEGKRRLAATGVPKADCTPICNVRLMSALTVCGMSWLLLFGANKSPGLEPHWAAITGLQGAAYCFVGCRLFVAIYRARGAVY